MADWANTQGELDSFLGELEGMLNSLSLTPIVYGSFATRLWLNHCDIDLLLIPNTNSPV